MRQTILLLLVFFKIHLLSAQVYITPGASLHFTGNVNVTLDKIGLTNHGAFFPDSSVVLFSGSGSHSIAGNENISFYELHIDKASGGEVFLVRPISVGNRILFNNGYLSIGNHDVDLGRTGMLQSEFENERLRSTGTGRVIAARTINGGVNQLPGNIGVSITTNANLGDVIVRRGHLPQSGNGLPNSIQRWYEIEPQFTPPGANVTIRLSYFDAELNGLDENTLQVYHSQDNINWTMLPVSLRQTTHDYVELAGVQSFGRFTLAAAGGILPVQFAALNVRCENGNTLITWHTASEQASQRFAVQRSSDGVQWTEIGSVPASGNSNTQKAYNFNDTNPLVNSYYRLAQYDVSGRIQYSAALRSACGNANKFLVWPNPTQGNVFVSLTATTSSNAIINVYDSKGSLVKEKRATVLSGNNQITIDISSLPAGMYTITTNNNGTNNSTKIFKQ